MSLRKVPKRIRRLSPGLSEFESARLGRVEMEIEMRVVMGALSSQISYIS